VDNNQAMEKLGLTAEQFTQENIKSAYSKLKHELEEKLKEAPTEGLLQKYATRLKEIEEAHNILLSSNKTVPFIDLSASMLSDLPSDRPSYTNLGHTRLGDQLDQSVALSIGRLLANRYEIRGLIDIGGMGAVYSAYDRNKDQEIAIKVLLPRLLGNPEARQRFINEAKIATSLAHPGILNVFDIQNDGNLSFITMEKLEGCSLRAAMKIRKISGKPWTVKEICAMGTQLCEALSFAHDSTIHRDIKPENIWLCNTGRIKIMDFGIARLLSNEQLTSSSLALGTAYYMAPEQIQNAKNIDHRADQYSLGVVLYELLTEHLPSGRFKAPKALRKEIPQGLSNAIMHALGSHPEDRFPDMVAFGTRLKKYQEDIFTKFHLNIVIPATIIAILLLTSPFWIKAVKLFIFPIDLKLKESVTKNISELSTIHDILEKTKDEYNPEQKKVLQQFQDLFKKAQSLQKDDKFQEADKMLKEKIKSILLGVDEVLRELSNKYQIDCQDKQFVISKDFNDLKKNMQESKSNQQQQKNKDLLDTFDKYYNADIKYKAEVDFRDGMTALKEKKYSDSLTYLKKSMESYEAFFSHYDSARDIIMLRYDFNLSSQLTNYKKKYPFIDKSFYQKFEYREAELSRISDKETENTGQKISDIRSDLNQAEKLASQYLNVMSSINNLKVPSEFSKRQNDLLDQLKKAKSQIEQHAFQKAVEICNSVEQARVKLIKEFLKQELSSINDHIKKSELLSSFTLLLRFDSTWSYYFQSTNFSEYKQLYDNLWKAVKKHDMPIGKTNITLIYLPGKTFNMGSPDTEMDREAHEGPVHPVKLDGFWISQFEITQEQYKKIMGSNPSRTNISQNPVENISWYDAKKFCEALSKKTSQYFRLPTEAEWEYACRAGNDEAYHWGEQWNSSKALADNTRKTPTIAGSYPPNKPGLYDMEGNVWEWCEDWYAEKYYLDSPKQNPKGPDEGFARVIRGGSFSSSHSSCRSAARDFQDPGHRASNLGFRIVCLPIK